MADDDTTIVDDIFKDLEASTDKNDGEKGGEKTLTKKDDLTVDELKTQLDAMKSERHGLLQAAKSERHKRQDIKTNLDNLTNTVNNILQQRQAGKKDDANDVGVPVEFSEDGDTAFIASNKITDLLTPLHDKIADLENVLKTTSTAVDGQRKAQDTIEAIVGSDDRFDKVYNKYKFARNWVNDQVIDFQRENNMTGVMTSGQALDHVLTKELESEFKEKFPELSMVDVITAGDSQRHFTNMLSNAADTFDELLKNDNSQNTSDNEKFKKIINKPAGLSDNTNAKANELSVVEKVGSLASADIFDLSDAQAKQLEAALLEEEKSEGIKF